MPFFVFIIIINVNIIIIIVIIIIIIIIITIVVITIIIIINIIKLFISFFTWYKKMFAKQKCFFEIISREVDFHF